MLMVLDGTPRRILDAGQNEIRDRAPLQCRRVLDEALLVRGDARFQALSTDSTGRGFLSRFSHFLGLLFVHYVRPVAGKINR
jgi:hypothetical protein